MAALPGMAGLWRLHWVGLGLIPEDEVVSSNVESGRFRVEGLEAASCALWRPTLAAGASGLGGLHGRVQSCHLCGDCLAVTGSLLCQ